MELNGGPRLCLYKHYSPRKILEYSPFREIDTPRVSKTNIRGRREYSFPTSITRKYSSMPILVQLSSSTSLHWVEIYSSSDTSGSCSRTLRLTGPRERSRCHGVQQSVASSIFKLSGSIVSGTASFRGPRQRSLYPNSPCSLMLMMIMTRRTRRSHDHRESQSGHNDRWTVYMPA